ncbi:hypothetical protein [Vibrio misgurnus]|uniref:hypothetical protein n=1 Tax=Vibrio misgurnus TaxID=2993714 RepID=UPI002417888A|nr:hypothetical protein [Vibrio sp. gvc]
MIDRHVRLIIAGASLSCRYDPFGIIHQYVLKNDEHCTFVPKGSSSFLAIEKYVNDKSIKIESGFEWVEIIKNQTGEVLYYLTNVGAFTDADNNSVSNELKMLIDEGSIDIREPRKFPWVKNIEVSVFLPRKYQLSGSSYEAIRESKIASESLGLSYEINPRFLQEIESDYFDGSELIQEQLDYSKGLVFRFDIDTKNVGKVFSWSKVFLSYELEALEQSLLEDLALHKRSKSKGPRTNWYFDWVNLQNYLWTPVLHFSNRVIGMINMQAHRKDMPLMSKDRVGDMACIRVQYSDDSRVVQPISKLQDSQISVFPDQLNWDYNPTDIAFNRIRFLYNQGLYYESLIVAQSFLESLVNGMFDCKVVKATFNRNELKWEQKYKYLNSFFGHQLRDDSHLKSLFNGGLKEIYSYRNMYAHDYIEHQPDYSFDISLYKKVSMLLKPFMEYHERTKFLVEVSSIYSEKQKFLLYLSRQKAST